MQTFLRGWCYQQLVQHGCWQSHSRPGAVHLHRHHPHHQPRGQMHQTDPDSEVGPGPDQAQFYLLGPCYHLIKQNNKKRTRTYRKEVGCLVESCNSNMKLETIEVVDRRKLMDSCLIQLRNCKIPIQTKIESKMYISKQKPLHIQNAIQ